MTTYSSYSGAGIDYGYHLPPTPDPTIKLLPKVKEPLGQDRGTQLEEPATFKDVLDLRDCLERGELEPQGRHLRVEWSRDKALVTWPTATHAFIAATIIQSIQDAGQSLGSKGRLSCLGSADVDLPGHSFQPDFQIRDKRAKEDRDIPTIVFEVAFSQSLEKALSKAVDYLGASEGAISQVIVVNITHQNYQFDTLGAEILALGITAVDESTVTPAHVGSKIRLSEGARFGPWSYNLEEAVFRIEVLREIPLIKGGNILADLDNTTLDFQLDDLQRDRDSGDPEQVIFRLGCQTMAQRIQEAFLGESEKRKRAGSGDKESDTGLKQRRLAYVKRHCARYQATVHKRACTSSAPPE